MIELLKQHWEWIIYGLIFSYCVWHGFKIEFNSGNILFSYEVYPLKRFF